jgi:twitching motility protein PilT
MAKLDELFQIMVKEGASDLHLSSGSPPFFRIFGHMVQLKMPVMTAERCEKLIRETMAEDHLKTFHRKMDLDWSYLLPDVGRFRANAFMQIGGIGAVYRLVPETVKTLEDLGLPESIRSLADSAKGLVLVTGPTGSGKSTTLAALIHHINLTRKEHIITIEDPIEYVHKGRNCLVNQREVSRHTKSFANALRAALREDPDVILVGELRDPETMALALTAAETGHLVFATLHTNSAAKSIDRIIDTFPPEQQAQIRVMLSESLMGVVAQQLLPRADRPGMVPAIEVLIATPAIRNLIRENKTFQIPSIIQTSNRAGMMTFEKSIRALVEKGVVSAATAAAYMPVAQAVN